MNIVTTSEAKQAIETVKEYLDKNPWDATVAGEYSGVDYSLIKDSATYFDYLMNAEDKNFDYWLESSDWTANYIVENAIGIDAFDAMDDIDRDVVMDFIREQLVIPSPEPYELKVQVNVMPGQAENLNYEGSLLCGVLEGIVDALNGEGSFEDIPEGTVLSDLFASQGYVFADLADENKVKESAFLKSFLDEMAECYEGMPTFLVFLAEMTLQDYYSLRNRKSEMVFTKGTCGLFNPVTGSGALLELELERPFTCKVDGNDDYPFYALQVEDGPAYGYTVNSIYGLCESAWRADMEIKDVVEK